MKELCFENLTQEQIDFVNSGCGPGKLGFLVPEFIFAKACCNHDIAYYKGGTEKDRWKADYNFFKDMQKAIDEKDLSWIERRYYFTFARLYFAAVVSAGWTSFSYGKQKTIEDLEKEMSNFKGGINE